MLSIQTSAIAAWRSERERRNLSDSGAGKLCVPPRRSAVVRWSAVVGIVNLRQWSKLLRMHRDERDKQVREIVRILKELRIERSHRR